MSLSSGVAQQTYLPQDTLRLKHAVHRTLRFVVWCNLKISQELCRTRFGLTPKS